MLMLDKSFKTLRVLVLEDNKFLVQLIKQIVRSFGVNEISDFNDVTRAKKAVKNRQFDIAIVEVKMPKEDGFKFVKYVRTAPESQNKTMPVIMLSAVPTRRIIGQAIASGAEEFLAMPIVPKKLYERIAGLIQRPHSYIQINDYSGPERRRVIMERFEDAERRIVDDAEIASSLKQKAGVD
jgi:DNA-binding response OmpR family regulator